ncbi:MAG: TolC family protein, partial [Deltaproteobacteria bacterium]|nr:TolC family protein [Deltaproteobacteria bacterium]
MIKFFITGILCTALFGMAALMTPPAVRADKAADNLSVWEAAPDKPETGKTSAQKSAAPKIGTDWYGNTTIQAKNQYTLAEAVERALDHNFSVKASEENVKAAENWRKSVRGSFGPALGTSYGYTHRQLENDDLYNWRAALTQNVFSGFATLAAYQKAALQKDSSEASLYKARL